MHLEISKLEMAQSMTEIFAGCICLMLCLIIVMNRHKAFSMKIFVRLFFTSAFLFFFDAAAYIFRGNVDIVSIISTRVANFTVFVLNCLLAIYYVQYIYEIAKENGTIISKLYFRIANLAFLAEMIILVVNIFTKWMYYFDSENIYHRNWLWYIYTALSLIIIFSGCYAAIKNRHALNTMTVISVLLFSFVPILAIVVQSFFYGLSLINYGIAVSVIIMLLVYLLNWSKGDFVDYETDEKNRKLLQVVALYIVMVVIMSASIFSCILSIRNISRETSTSGSTIIGHLVNDSIDNIFLRPITVASTMAENNVLKEMFSSSDNPEDYEAKLQDYLSAIKENYNYQTVFAVDTKTMNYYTQQGKLKQLDLENDAHDVWYSKFLNTDKPYEIVIDTDESNDFALSAFVNVKIYGDDGEIIGVTGVCVFMPELQETILDFEKEHNIKIQLVDKDGLILVSSNTKEIQEAKVDNDYFSDLVNEEFTYTKFDSSSRLTRYCSLLDWYLVIEDNQPEKINVAKITIPSIAIFVAGLFMMSIAFSVIMAREQKTEKMLAEKKKASLTDGLTGLLNRHAYQEDLEALRNEKDISNLTIIMMDINGLKTANDSLGHVAGDELINGAASCMVSPFKEHGKVYRIGGDEFVALLRCSKAIVDDALITFDHIVNNWHGDLVKELSISKGIVSLSDYPNESLEEVFERADKLMYEDKERYYERTGKARRK